MSSNSLGKHFVVTSFGESHGEAVGVVIDGCPPRITLDFDEIQLQLNRRRPGQSELSTSRVEDDTFKIISGLLDKTTTGAPICILIKNKNAKSQDYDHLKEVYRPSHADYTYAKKYGIRDVLGGGRSSARITAGWVAAGAIAYQLLRQMHSISILAHVCQIHDIKVENSTFEINSEQVDASPVRCPNTKVSAAMEKRILEMKERGDSVGGVIQCTINNCPVGVGNPVFEKLQAQLGHAMLNINAVKGFEYGTGFQSALYTGSQLNDSWEVKDDLPVTSSNHSGGIQGGISNGMPIEFRVAFKPTSSISMTQETINSDLEPTQLAITGRHDPCVVPRAVPIVEALSAIVLLDNLLINDRQN